MTPPKTPPLAIVTGTSTGIGAALAEALLTAGWTVVGIARRPADLDHDHYRHLAVDLGDARALDDLVTGHLRPLLAEQPWPRIALVNNAARIGALRAVSDLEPDDLAAIMAVNVVAPVGLMALCLREAPPRTSLRIVNISSGAAHMAIPGLADYCASKAALHIAGQTAAAELADGHRDAAVFSYEPGIVDTPMQDSARGADPDKFPSHGVFVAMQADGRLAAPQDVVGPVVDFVTSRTVEPFTAARFGD